MSSSRWYARSDECVATGIAIAVTVQLALSGVASARRAEPVLRTAVPKWDAVSIRRCENNTAPASGVRAGYVNPSPGRLHVRCMWVRYLIEMAYVQHADLQSSGWTKPSSVPLSGGPKWIESDLFTIEAKADGLPNARLMMGPMLRALLEDRFKLKLRTNVKDIPIYEMRVAPSGFKLQPMPDGGCTSQDKAPTPGSPEWKGIGRNRICGNTRGGRNGPLIALNLIGSSLADLAAQLELDRLVVDKTNIPGLFDISLTFGKDSTTDRMFGGTTARRRLRTGPDRRPVTLHSASGAARTETGTRSSARHLSHDRINRNADSELIRLLNWNPVSIRGVWLFVIKRRNAFNVFGFVRGGAWISFADRSEIVGRDAPRRRRLFPRPTLTRRTFSRRFKSNWD